MLAIGWGGDDRGHIKPLIDPISYPTLFNHHFMYFQPPFVLSRYNGYYYVDTKRFEFIYFFLFLLFRTLCCKNGEYIVKKILVS